MRPEFSYEPLTPTAFLHRAAYVFPDRIGCIDGTVQFTYATLLNRCLRLAGALRAVQAIPLLIFAQATADRLDSTGDVAWIAIATQQAFVAAVEPVVGSGAGAFRPIPGVVQEGVVLRVVDAVVTAMQDLGYRSFQRRRDTCGSANRSTARENTSPGRGDATRPGP